MARSGRKAAQEVVVAALACGRSVKEAAASASVSERTAWRWLAKPEFKAQVDKARAELLEGALGKLSGMLAAGAGVLARLLASGSDGIRLGAVRLLFETVTKWKEVVDHEQRLAALELAQKQQGGAR